MKQSLIEEIEMHVRNKLVRHLSPGLYYHGIHHTEEVLQSAKRIAAEEGITDEEDLKLLHIACLYHDVGFIDTYKGHEVRGCEIASEELKEFGFNESQIDLITGMIMATRLPQSPNTLLEKIICDSDLDYLGGDDFDAVSDSLFREQSGLGMIGSREEWNTIQLKFLKNHNYFTESVRKLRDAGKAKHLARIQSIVESYDK